MNKISRLGAYVLGAALGSGCVSTFNQSDLYDMIASDKKIDASDYRAFVSAERTLTERIKTLEGEERARSQAVLEDVQKVISKYENKANANAKIKIQPVFDFFANGEIMNLNGTKDSGDYLELTLEDLANKIGATNALNIIRFKTAPTWESTYGKKGNAERLIYRVPLNTLISLFGSDPKIADDMSVIDHDSGCFVLKATTGIRAIVNYGVDVTDADLESLANLKPVEPAEPVEEQTEKKDEQPAKKKSN